MLTLCYCFVTDGPYSVFAGRDASRGLALFSVSEDVIREEYDDLSDLNSEQMERVREWEQQLSGKFIMFLETFDNKYIIMYCCNMMHECRAVSVKLAF